MRKLIGVHLLNDWSKWMNLLHKMQPPVVLGMHSNVDELKRLKEGSPSTKIIFRWYRDDSDYDNSIKRDPEGFAEVCHREMMERHIPQIDYVQYSNEVLQNWDTLPFMDRFYQKAMQLADRDGKFKLVVGNFSTGNPDYPEKIGDPAGFNGRMLMHQRVMGMLQYADANGHLMGYHQYNAPNLINNDDSDNWYIWRIEKQLFPYLDALGLRNLKFVFNEHGIDYLIRGEVHGFQGRISNDEYVRQYLEWERVEQQWADRVVGACIYSAGAQSPWESYSITDGSNVLEQLANHYANNSEQYSYNPITQEASLIPEVDAPIEIKPSEIKGTPIPKEDKMETKRELDVSAGAKKMNLQILPTKHKIDDDTIWVVKHIFTTQNGKWDVDQSKEFGIEQRFRDRYLKPWGDPLYFDDAGSDISIFGLMININGNYVVEGNLVAWSDGPDKLNNPDYKGYVKKEVKKSGWGNFQMYGSSSFGHDRGEHGPWSLMPDRRNVREFVTGIGLPLKQHASTFVVWQEIKRGQVVDPRPVPPRPVPEKEYYVVSINWVRQQGFAGVQIVE